MQKRKDCYYNFFRCGQLSLPYKEGLEEEPIYILRKFFQKDKTKMRNLTEQPQKRLHILGETQTSEKEKTDFALEIENQLKIQNIIVQTPAHVTTDIKIMKQIAYTEMTAIYRTIKKVLSSLQKVPKKTISSKIINLSKYKLKNHN